jgi:CHASE1-domain containing sensor protein
MRQLRALWLPLGILLLTLGMTWQAWNHERTSSQSQLKTHFNHALQETISRIEQRMGAYEQLLRGVQAALREQGPCPQHRHTFAPVREAQALAGARQCSL